jgi:hypothetical protein
MRHRVHRPSPALIVALIALFVALGGTGYAAATGSIDGREIKNSSIQSKDIKNSSVTGSDVKNKSLTPGDFSGSVTGPAGAQGARGPAGLSGVERVAETVPNSSNNAKTHTVTCPVGKRVIGGGARIVSGEGQVTLDESYPNSDTTYFGETRTIGGGNVDHGLVVVAICANTQ